MGWSVGWTSETRSTLMYHLCQLFIVCLILLLTLKERPALFSLFHLEDSLMPLLR